MTVKTTRASRGQEYRISLRAAGAVEKTAPRKSGSLGRVCALIGRWQFADVGRPLRPASHTDSILTSVKRDRIGESR